MSDDEYREETWRDALPEALRDAPFIKKAESAEDAAQQIANSAQWQGNSIKLPGEGDDTTAFLEKVQPYLPEPVVEEPAEPAELELPEDIPEHLAADVQELGLTQTQLDALMTRHQGQVQERTDYIEEQDTALRDSWGMDFKDNHTAVANLLIQTAAPENFINAFEKGELSAQSVQWLSNLNQLGSEASEVGMQPTASAVPSADNIASIDRRLMSGTLDPVEYQRVLAEKVQLLKRMA
jgi:hypothetical protein